MIGSASVYLAARYSRFRELQVYRDDLRSLGYRVQARWVDGEHEMIDNSSTDEQSRGFAMDDLHDLLQADVFIHFSDEPEASGRARGGRHVEFGAALIKRRSEIPLGQRPTRIVLVGRRENVFHFLPEVEHFETWPEALAVLAEANVPNE